MFDYRQFIDAYASIEDMRRWAYSVMESRPPDFIIGAEPLLPDYMHRWHILPRNAMQNVYLHLTMRDDDDVMHNHPWASTSLIIENGYQEDTPEGTFIRKPGDVIERTANAFHRLKLIEGRPSISLFFTGYKEQEWGFDCGGRFVPWQIFTGGKHAGRSATGQGCGEN